MHFEDLLYLDLDFLADKFEEETGTAPKTVISKNEGMEAHAGFSFLKSGLHSQVTRQFVSSSQTMLSAVESKLAAYPDYKVSFESGHKPTNAWIKGRLTIGQWGDDEKNSKTALNVFFEVKAGEDRFALLPKNEYFLANLEALEIISPALQRWIQIPVRVLAKVLYPLPDIQTVVVTPYIILAADA